MSAQPAGPSRSPSPARGSAASSPSVPTPQRARVAVDPGGKVEDRERAVASAARSPPAGTTTTRPAVAQHGNAGDGSAARDAERAGKPHGPRLAYEPLAHRNVVADQAAQPGDVDMDEAGGRVLDPGGDGERGLEQRVLERR